METSFISTSTGKKKQISFEEIPLAFWSKFRNAMSAERLTLIESLADEIELPAKIGEFSESASQKGLIN